MWPVLTGAELVRDLFGFPELIHSASAGVLTADEEAMLHRPRTARHRDTPWTEGDVALVDEAEALLGPVEEARSRRGRRRGVEEAEALRTATRVVEEMGLEGYTDAATLAARFGEPDDRGAPVGRRAADLRTRARRRGAGPHPDAVADGRSPGSVGIAEPRRRLRAGEPTRRGRRVGHRHRPAPTPRRLAGRARSR